MRIYLARSRAFCAGVDRAIEIVERALSKYGPPVYVRKQIVHNEFVVNQLAAKGAVFVEEVDEAPPRSVVVFSAHGVSPAVRQEADSMGHRVIDATCPLVTKVHVEAKRGYERGDQVVLIAHAGHDETLGTMGEVPGIHLVESTDDVLKLGLDSARGVTFITQTTLANDEVSDIVGHLVARYPLATPPPSEDVCYASQNRQKAVKELAEKCDTILVVGSRSSSNANRLVEVAIRSGCQASLIDDSEGIPWAAISEESSVGVAAGASTPEMLVVGVVSELKRHFGDCPIIDLRVNSEDFEYGVQFTIPSGLRDSSSDTHNVQEAPSGSDETFRSAQPPTRKMRRTKIRNPNRRF